MPAVDTNTCSASLLPSNKIKVERCRAENRGERALKAACPVSVLMYFMDAFRVNEKMHSQALSIAIIPIARG
jgi:hypothetical protein